MNAEQRHLRLNRILLLVAGTAYLGWWLFVHFALPSAFNPFASRALVVACFFAALAAGYAWPAFARRLDDALAVCCGIATAHYFYLFDQNEADLNWMIGSYITVIAVCAILQTQKALWQYSALVTLLSIIVVARAPDVSYVVFLPGMLTILSFANFGLHERLRLLERLRESHQRFEGLFDAGFEGIAVCDQDVVQEANDALAQLLGHARADLIGRPLAELGLAGALSTSDTSRQGAAPHETTLARKDGTRITVEVNSKPHVLNGKPMRLLAFRDLTERKRAEGALLAANRELEAFSYSVAHDLRAPLRGISGFSHILLEDHGDQLEGEAKDYLRRIRVAGETMAQLIDALLGLARVSRTALRRETVDLASLAETIIEQLRSLHPERTVEFTCSVTRTVRGDPALLRAVLENLLGNAWKFTGKRASAHIELGCTEEATGPVYFVEDDGAGFDMAYASKLFAPFQRLHKVTEFTGTGVGLATAQRIISRHGGRLWAEGRVDEGATFYFSLEEGST